MGACDCSIEITRADDGSFIITVPVKAKPDKGKKGATMIVGMKPMSDEKTYTAKTIDEMLSVVKKAAKTLTPDGVDDDDMNDKQSGFDQAMAEQD
jgi:hypothetical protein